MKDYKLYVTELAQEDLKIGQKFYEIQAEYLGDYFIDTLLTEKCYLNVFPLLSIMRLYTIQLSFMQYLILDKIHHW